MDKLPDDDLLPLVSNFRRIVVEDQEELMTAEWEIVERYLRSLARKSSHREPKSGSDMEIDKLLDRLEAAGTIDDERQVLNMFLVLLPQIIEQH